VYYKLSFPEGLVFQFQDVQYLLQFFVWDGAFTDTHLLVKDLLNCGGDHLLRIGNVYDFAPTAVYLLVLQLVHNRIYEPISKYPNVQVRHVAFVAFMVNGALFQIHFHGMEAVFNFP
jgi:hypothetical protein